MYLIIYLFNPRAAIQNTAIGHNEKLEGVLEHLVHCFHRVLQDARGKTTCPYKTVSFFQKNYEQMSYQYL